MNIESTKLQDSTQPPLLQNGCYVQPFSEVFNEDCIQVMKRYPDKFFDLAIVDPPYGIDINNQSQGKGGGVSRKIEYTKYDWDKQAPNKEYFDELMRVSKNQIIWGANHFIEQIPYNASCWIVWDKENGETDFADCELAWTSFKTAVRKFKWKWAGMLQQNMKDKETRIHPTQKPIALYEWLMQKYAKEGDLILDTHLGSGSSRIAAHKQKLSFVGCELNNEYFVKQEARFKEFVSQLRLF
jgi:site-specific DNA-methyltransferase (adenine-specific)